VCKVVYGAYKDQLPKINVLRGNFEGEFAWDFEKLKINTSNEKHSKTSHYKLMKCLHIAKIQMGMWHTMFYSDDNP
jgi:hypothetical protein